MHKQFISQHWPEVSVFLSALALMKYKWSPLDTLCQSKKVKLCWELFFKYTTYLFWFSILPIQKPLYKISICFTTLCTKCLIIVINSQISWGIYCSLLCLSISANLVMMKYLYFNSQSDSCLSPVTCWHTFSLTRAGLQPAMAAAVAEALIRDRSWGTHSTKNSQIPFGGDILPKLF